MIVTARAIYRDGRLIFYNSHEIPEDGTEVIISFEKHSKTSVSSLRGSLAKHIPEDFDLDAELRKIRKEWEQEMEEIIGGC